MIGGKPAKYLSAKGAAPRVYFPPGTRKLTESKFQEIIITEGEIKAACGAQHGYCVIGIAGVDCWAVRKSSRLIPDLESIEWKGRTVFICFDSDATTNQSVRAAEELLAAALTARGAIVKIVRLPAGTGGAKVGMDDYLAANGSSAFHSLLKSAEDPADVAPAELRAPASEIDAYCEAGGILAQCEADGVSKLARWRGGTYYWRGGAFEEIEDEELRGIVYLHLNRNFFKLHSAAASNVVEQINLHPNVFVSSRNKSPNWRQNKPGDWPTGDIVAFRNGIVNLEWLAAGRDDCFRDSTPRLFNVNALDFDFSHNPANPAKWFWFLDRSFDDSASRDLLQDWFGYLLTPWTDLHKFLVMVGPPRSGKGTVGRVANALIGPKNCAGPSLIGMGTQFGLQPLLGKLLATISDARINSNSPNAFLAVERVLSIVGEDPLTIERKFKESIDQILTTRLMMFSNELPKLPDNGGGLAARMLVIRQTQSFLGKEDPGLTADLLKELPGIFLWAVQGWKRLKDRKYFIAPDSGVELQREIADLASPVGAFVRDRCETGKGKTALASDVFDAWRAWCGEMNRDDSDRATFGRDLRSVVSNLAVVQRTVEGKRGVRAYEGLALKCAA
jgi:putative DNA primase/helicase